MHKPFSDTNTYISLYPEALTLKRSEDEAEEQPHQWDLMGATGLGSQWSQEPNKRPSACAGCTSTIQPSPGSKSCHPLIKMLPLDSQSAIAYGNPES